MALDKITSKLQQLKKATLHTKEVDVFGLKVGMRLLPSVDEAMIYDGVSQLEGVPFLLALKKDMIARSIYAIDGEDIPAEVPGEDKAPAMPRHIYLKETVLSDLPQSVIDSLHEAYLVMSVEFQKKSEGSIKFENSDMIQEFLKEDVAKRVAAEAVGNMIDAEVNKAENSGAAKAAGQMAAITPKV